LTMLWHAPSLQRSSRRLSQRCWLLPNSWRWIARPRSSTGGSASSGRAMRQASSRAAIAPSVPTTDSSRVVSSVHGGERRQNSHVARMSGRACSRARSATVSVRSVLYFATVWTAVTSALQRRGRRRHSAMREAIRALGVSRQTVLQRVKRCELEAVHITRGRRKGLRIKG